MKTLKIYIETRHPRRSLETLASLESCSENLADLLESYRFLQPDGNLFSVKNIEKISRLQSLHEAVAGHEQERDYHERMIERYSYEIDCIENRREIVEAEQIALI